MSYYLIATDDFDEATQGYWSIPHGWVGALEGATVYTGPDLRAGVRLPTGGYWLRITPEGITRHDGEPE